MVADTYTGMISLRWLPSHLLLTFEEKKFMNYVLGVLPFVIFLCIDLFVLTFLKAK